MLRTANPSRYAMCGDCVGIVPEDGFRDTLELLTRRQLHDIDLYLLNLCRKRTIRCGIDNGCKLCRLCFIPIGHGLLAAGVTAANDPHNRGQKQYYVRMPTHHKKT